MAVSEKCPECDSSDVIPNVPVSTLVNTGYGGTQLMVTVAENPEAMIFKHKHLGVIVARVCGQCGLVRLFAHNPQELLAAHTKGSNA
jgi:hypothetical protein